MSKELFEGIKFGNKEKQFILDHADEYFVGIEYEFNYEGEEVNFDDVIDISQADDEILHDLDKLYDNHDMFLEPEYSEYIADYVESVHDMDSSVPSKVMDFLTLTTRLVKKIREFQSSDTETQDLFPDDKKASYVILYRDVLKDSVNDEGEVELYSIKDIVYNHEINLREMYDICTVLDVYFDGDLFGANSEMMKDFYNFYQSNTLFDERFFNITEITNDEYLDSIDKDEIVDVSDAIEMLSNSSLITTELDIEHLSYTVEPDGFSYGDFTLPDYISYVENYHDVLGITRHLVDTARENLEDIIQNYEVNEDEIRDQIPHIDKIVDEHDEMIEVITEKMDVDEALLNIETMFKYLQNHRVESYAGMHISISSRIHDHDDFNIAKFITIMDIDYISEFFPERSHVLDLQEIVIYEIEKVIDKYILTSVLENDSLVDVVKNLEQYISNTNNKEKFQTINFKDYDILGGRIELRFFGGENYHERYGEIGTHLFRALYLLNFAYTDEYNKEYYKKLSKMANSVVKEKYGFTMSYLYSSLKAISKRIDLSEFFEEFDEGNPNQDSMELFERYFKKKYIDVIQSLHRVLKSW